MEKKNLFQIVLTFLLLLIGFLTFSTYYKSDDNKSKKIEIKDTKSAKSKDNKNLIQDIKYTSNNTNGDIFEILAVQNALTGGKFVKKWLQVITFDVLGYLFHHRKYSNFDSFM